MMMMKSIFSVSLLYTSVSLFAATFEPNLSFVDQAWQAWEQNDQAKVEELFTQALKQNSENRRAHIGLSFLYSLQQKHGQAWAEFQKFLETEKNIYPYIYSAWFTGMFSSSLHNPEAGALALVEQLTQEADSGGILRAMAHEKLGGHYQDIGRFSKSRENYRLMNSIDDWTVIGPFENISASGFEKVFAPELEYEIDRVYDGKNGIPAKWFRIEKVRDSHWIDFRRYFAYFQSVFYANNFVYSPKKQTVQIRVGTSGSLKAFLNDDLIIEYFDENNNDLDTYIVETSLQQGWNRLLIKCGFSEINECNFMVRITDSAGERIKGLKISTEKQSYPQHPNEPVISIENFAEAFFKEKIEQQPEQIENYVLLAECYLRNDKAIEAELVLKEGLMRSPNCVLLHERLIEAYTRGEKNDEVATTMEKIYNFDQQVPSVLIYKIDRYLENGNFDRALGSIQALEKLIPESVAVYEAYIQYFSKKKLIEKLLEFSSRAYEKYPENYSFAVIEASFAVQKTQKYDTAIQILRDQLTKRYETTAVTSLAEAYLKASKIDKCEEVYEKALEIDPAATGFYYKLATINFSLQRYAQAEEAVKRAIDVCPNASTYWSALGDIYRVQDKTKLAKTAYSEALRFRPADYATRDKLRELDGEKSVFTNFVSLAVDSLILSSPQAADYPKDDSIILLDDTKRVVYSRNASETSRELLIKPFNADGVERYKEYWISYNSNSQTLAVEKAVVIKKNGSEVKADIDDSHIVFKSMEPHDHIYLKWKLKDYYSGKLAEHFFDTVYLNGYDPIKYASYALLVPENRAFYHKTQKIEDNPTKRKTKDGILYSWTITDEPAVDYEYLMPGLQDAGKVLYISTVDNWNYFVDWYSDLAKTKTRSSYEIKLQVAELFEGKEGLTEQAKIETIYNFITENISYSYVAFRQSGLVPQKARDVLVNKIGDCKDMTTLSIAMLNEAGIKAHYTLLNTVDEGYNREILPSISFNHCIAGVETTDGIRYLDLTARNYSMDSRPPSNNAAFSLLIRPGVMEPFYLPEDGVSRNITNRKTKVTVREDNSILVETNNRKTGRGAASMRNLYRSKSPDQREEKLTQIISTEHPNVKLIKLEFENLDEIGGEIRYSYSYEVPDYVTGPQQIKSFGIPWADAIYESRGLAKALAYEDRKYPYYYWPRVDKEVEEMTITVPGGFEPILNENASLSSGIADYSLTYEFKDKVITLTRVLSNKKSVVLPGDEYISFKKMYRAAVIKDKEPIYLQRQK